MSNENTQFDQKKKSIFKQSTTRKTSNEIVEQQTLGLTNKHFETVNNVGDFM